MSWIHRYVEHNLLNPDFLPIYVARVVDETHWSIQCADCGRINTHGAEVGYRHSHCRCEAEKRPGLMSGYILAPPGAKFAPYLDHCPKCGLSGGFFTPVDLAPQSDRGIAASYVCDESHGWISSWGDLPYGPRSSRGSVAPDARRCALYRHYDRTGVLLYIGITENPEGRIREHARSSAWVPYAHSMTAQWFDTRDAAEVAERAAIRTEVPVFNIAHAVGDVDARIQSYVRASA